MITHELHAAHPDAAISGAPTDVVWNLTEGTRTDYRNGVVVGNGPGPMATADGIEGMGHPKVDVFARETPRGAGRVRTGTRARERSAFLPLVFIQRGQEWIDSQKLFWRCFSPDRTASWRVISPDGTWRELIVYLDPQDTIYPRDPTAIRQVLGLALLAELPFWLGPEQVAVTASDAGMVPFFGEAGNAPPFYIQPGSSTAGSAFTVAGDVDVWPVLTVMGPSSGFQVQELFEGYGVVGGISVPSGQKLVLDFDPTAQAAMRRPANATSGGTNVTGQLTSREFFPIRPTFQPDVQVVLLSMVGSGYAQLSYRPRYWRAI